MSHVRQQIREYFVTQLTGLSTTGSNIYSSRIYPLGSAKLPAVIVYSQSETIDELAFSNKRTQIRSLELAVEGYVRATSSFDDTLDTISSEIEQAILDAPTLGGLAKNTQLSSVEAMYSGDGEQPVGTIRLIFNVQYSTETGQPETAI